ncbi:mitochondrial genome maintenance exonuclease 1-like isoform X2 [Apis laboriosa]|uniref:mitochondrial genome maintenance exonuclease 1-like isoform X2 n=1 Tax=Apis laboriosa TaxID=183418 RepID=UPI001CC5EDA5|nr:mitochondrial genome maintenance exonuclease 1-like isoform X2 [Apis laboriosa]
MIRLRIKQSIKYRTVLKFNIKKERFSTKYAYNLNIKKQNEIVETTEASKLDNNSTCEMQSNQIISKNIVYKVLKQKKDKKIVQVKKKEDLELSEKPKINEVKTINKFKIMENLKSFSIFGSETIENFGIQCVENNIDLKIPSITNILNETMSLEVKAILEKWKKNIIDTFGETYFNKYRKDLLNNGKLFHSVIKNVLSYEETIIPPSIKSVYFSVQPILNDIQTTYALEENIMHPTLRYKGIVDCIASYRDEIYLIDWKKSDKKKASLAATFDAPVQLAAYIGAVNASNKYSFKIKD